MRKNSNNKILIRRYTKAFYNSMKEKDLETIKLEFLELKEIFLLEINNNIKTHFSLLNHLNQKSIVEKIFKKHNFNKIIYDFCLILSINARLKILPEIINEFVHILQIRNDSLIAKVTSAIDLSDEQIEEINLVLRKKFSKNILIKLHIDKQILGGLIINVGSNMFDDSLKSKIKNLNELKLN